MYIRITYNRLYLVEKSICFIFRLVFAFYTHIAKHFYTLFYALNVLYVYRLTLVCTVTVFLECLMFGV